MEPRWTTQWFIYHTLSANNQYMRSTMERTCSWITSKANRTLGVLRKNLRTPPIKVKGTTYKTLVRQPNRNRGVLFISMKPIHCKKHHAMEMVHRRAARWVLRRHDMRDSVTELLEVLDWETLEKRRFDPMQDFVTWLKLGLHQRRRRKQRRRQKHEIPYKPCKTETEHSLFSSVLSSFYRVCSGGFRGGAQGARAPPFCGIFAKDL